MRLKPHIVKAPYGQWHVWYDGGLLLPFVNWEGAVAFALTHVVTR